MEIPSPTTDFIGDIHGHADKLEALLKKLGYTILNGSYHHPESTVVFVGDYIDRGPQIRKTLQIVRAMVENGDAVALMGNHEYNALCFHYPESEGGHLRKHLIKNIVQHYETLRQFQNRQKEYEDYLEWFLTLPLYYETGHFRAVHACWDYQSIALLKNTLPNARLTDELIYESVIKGSDLNNAVEIVLKGKEILLPSGTTFTDKDGTSRREIRTRWWINPRNATYHDLSIEPLSALADQPVDPALLPNPDYYTEHDKPVFFGHYWLKGTPILQRSNVCCLDYSVAKNGELVGYRVGKEGGLKRGRLVGV